MQLALFNVARQRSLAPLSGAREHRLSSGAWLLHLPNWVRGHQSLFDELSRSLAFRRSRRAMYDRVVDVPRATYFGPIEHELVDEMQDALQSHLGKALPHRSAALYETGEDSVAWHGDKTGEVDDATVVTVSLGAPRRFLVRPARGIDDAAGTRAFQLGWGDLVVMGGTSQRTYEHAVPKAQHAEGARLVVMLRSHFDPG